MLGRVLAFALSVPLIALLALAAACDGDGAGNGVPTSTTAPTTGEAATPTAESNLLGTTPTVSQEIRQYDLSLEPGLAEFLASAGDVYVSSVKFIDLTDDGAEDALAVVTSTGEGGDIAAFVYGYSPGGPEELLRVMPESGTLTADILSGKLVISEPIYQPGDPLCCPSNMRTTAYEWDGSKLAVSEQQVVPAR